MTPNPNTSCNKFSDPQYVNGVLDLLSRKLDEVSADRPEHTGRDLEAKVITRAARLAINPLDEDALTSWQSAQDALTAYDQSASKSNPPEITREDV